MRTMLADFGTDHWYQLDGYFNGDMPPWITAFNHESSSGHVSHRGFVAAAASTTTARTATLPIDPMPSEEPAPPCTWSAALLQTYLAGCPHQGCKEFSTVAAAQAECVTSPDCGGITLSPTHGPQLRAGTTPQASPSHETSYRILNAAQCHGVRPDPAWQARGAAAYQGLSRTDPAAVWSFQGWAILPWDNPAQASALRGFVDAVPAGRFVIVDMAPAGQGEWQKWNNASFFGAPFIWTALHNFGGNDGMKGNLYHINHIPFDALMPAANTSAGGTGCTPEGIDQNPVYYEFFISANFRHTPVANLTDHVVSRSLRRYAAKEPVVAVANAWSFLLQSVYEQDFGLSDSTGVTHLPGHDSQFDSEGHPNPSICLVYAAWGQLINAAASAAIDPSLDPFRYDLVNTGREALAQLATLLSVRFADALSTTPLNATQLNRTAQPYLELLADIDTLLITEPAFLLGPWLQAARRWGSDASDCGDRACPDFYEWNARAQITSWYPTPLGAAKIPGGLADYASKQWAGLVADYYAGRAARTWYQGLRDAAAGLPLNGTAVDALKAQLAFEWVNSNTSYPLSPVGDAVVISASMHSKYRAWFASCPQL